MNWGLFLTVMWGCLFIGAIWGAARNQGPFWEWRDARRERRFRERLLVAASAAEVLALRRHPDLVIVFDDPALASYPFTPAEAAVRRRMIATGSVPYGARVYRSGGVVPSMLDQLERYEEPL